MSSYPRIFATGGLGGPWDTDSDSIRHLKDVLRLRPGDRLEVVVDRVVYTVQIDDLSVKSGRVSGTVIARVAVAPRTGDYHLIQGLPKGDKMAEIVRACTEMGVSTIVPVGMVRSVSTPTADRSDKKQIRWQQVAASAAAQSRQVAIPTVSPVTGFTDAVGAWADRDALKILFWESEQFLLPNVDWASPNQDIVMIIGPEGGITPQEVDVAVRAGFVSVSLGPTLLRVEHAALVAMAQLDYARLLKRNGKG